jgi:hypothetical protein
VRDCRKAVSGTGTLAAPEVQADAVFFGVALPTQLFCTFFDAFFVPFQRLALQPHCRPFCLWIDLFWMPFRVLLCRVMRLALLTLLRPPAMRKIVEIRYLDKA